VVLPRNVETLADHRPRRPSHRHFPRFAWHQRTAGRVNQPSMAAGTVSPTFGVEAELACKLTRRRRGHDNCGYLRRSQDHVVSQRDNHWNAKSSRLRSTKAKHSRLAKGRARRGPARTADEPRGASPLGGHSRPLRQQASARRSHRPPHVVTRRPSPRLISAPLVNPSMQATFLKVFDSDE